MDRCFLFQGQGSQLVGMGADIARDFPAAKQVFAEVDEALGEKLSDLIFHGPKEKLDLTENTQPSLMAMSMAICRAIESETGKNLWQLCKYMAGHSLGEYSAVCAAGSISLYDTAKILKLRGLSMQEAVPVGVGSMAAILGGNYEQVLAIVEQANNLGICEIANDNCDGQIVISGLLQAVEKSIEIARESGLKAVRLEVSAPFHCQLMAPVADKLSRIFEDIYIKKPEVPIVSNFFAKPINEVAEIKSMLVKQTCGQVQWRRSILYMLEQNCLNMVEIGTGRVLTGLNKRINATIVSSALNSSDAVRNFISTVKNI